MTATIRTKDPYNVGKSAGYVVDVGRRTSVDITANAIALAVICVTDAAAIRPRLHKAVFFVIGVPGPVAFAGFARDVSGRIVGEHDIAYAGETVAPIVLV